VLERPFLEHKDCVVAHEELTDAENGGVVADKGKVMKEHLQRLNDLKDGQFYVAKEVACFAPLETEGFDEWLLNFEHAILVREPRAACESLKRTGMAYESTYYDPFESGFEQCWLMKQRLTKVFGKEPLMIDADDDLLANP